MLNNVNTNVAGFPITGNSGAAKPGNPKEASYGELQTNAFVSNADGEKQILPDFIRDLPEEFFARALARNVKTNVFNIMHQAAAEGDFNRVNEIKGLFHQFRLGRFLPNFNCDKENFVTRLVSMTPAELASFQRLEEHLLSGRE